MYAERTDDAFIIGAFNKDHFRIIGLATTINARGKGLGKLLLKRAFEAAKEKGLWRVRTRTLSGAEFYARQGFDIVGMKGGDYLMELNLKQ